MEFNENMIWKVNNRWHYNESFIEFLREKSKEENVSIDGLSVITKMDYRTINKLLKQNDIEMKTLKNSVNFKTIYQNYEWCYEKYINEGLSQEEIASEANCTVRVLKKWLVEIHRITQKFRQQNKQLNQIQKDLIIGSLLGDGHIDRRVDEPMFIVGHAINQKDYLFYKYEIIKDLCNQPPVYREEQIRYFDDKGYLCKPQYRLCTRIHDCFKPLRSMSKTELIDNLNEYSLSIWILDDGNRSTSNWDLCIASLSLEEREYAINILKTKFNLECKLKKDNRYITFNADSSRNLDRIILNNIPNEIDIIQYKIINNDINKANNYLFVDADNEKIGLARFCKTNHLNYDKAKILYNKGFTKADELINMLKSV